MLSLAYFLCFRQCPAEQLPGLTDKCASCGRSYFDDVGATDASVVPPSYTEEKRRLSSESGPEVEACDCASLGRDVSKRDCIV